MTGSRTVVVTTAEPMRLDAWVRSVMAGTSRRLVHALIADGTIRVNGRRAAKGTRVGTGDVVELPVLAPLAPEPGMALAILHEDADLVAIDKPGGVPGHALDLRQRGSVAGALLARYPEMAAIDPLAAGLVHRLDTATSGVLLAARSRAVHAALRAAFRRRAITKHYLAVVAGTPSPGVIELPLAHDPQARGRMRVARPGERAWSARTRVVRVTPRGTHSVVEIEIATGVTHQIRLHLAARGHPVLGDLAYGGPPAGLAPGRHALHARQLVIPDRSLTIEAPLPEDLRPLLG